MSQKDPASLIRNPIKAAPAVLKRGFSFGFRPNAVLPRDVMVLFFCELSLKDLASCARVCKASSVCTSFPIFNGILDIYLIFR